MAEPNTEFPPQLDSITKLFYLEGYMLIPRFVTGLLWGGLMVLGTATVFGQDFPGKPIRLLIPEGGGANEFSARLMAQGISAPLGQAVVVEPRGALLVIETVAKAPPDGYTLLLQSSSFWVGPLLRKVSYDPVRDFFPVTMVSRAPNLLLVHPSLPVKSVKELIALAKSKPGQLNYSSGLIGTSAHLGGELFKAMAGVNIVHVAYKSSAPALTALMGGEVQVAFAIVSTATPFVKSGKLRALAVASAEPSALAPGLPTVAASGLPGFESTSIAGVFAPAKIPVAIINRLNQEMVRLLRQPDVKEKFLATGVEPAGNSPEEFAAYIKSDMARLNKLIKDAGIKVE